MKIAFTICSNNYLAQAKILADSVKRYSPDYIFFICLVDKINPLIDYEKEIGHQIILVEQIGIDDLDLLWKKYDIVEFNTCVKPFFFDFFISQYKELDYIYYFDPDTCLFASINGIESEFEECYDILLTPHIYSPIELDGKQPDEPIFLNFGIYNLGFLGLRNTSTSKKLIKWWQERTHELGYNNPSVGLFVDQLWFNLVPLFFEKVKITTKKSINMGPWNLHERHLIKKDNCYVVNNLEPLILYHFSNYKYDQPEKIASYYDRYSFVDRKDIVDLYEEYLNKLKLHSIDKISQKPCYYMNKRTEYLEMIRSRTINEYLEERKKKRTFFWWTKKVIQLMLPAIFSRFLKYKI